MPTYRLFSILSLGLACRQGEGSGRPAGRPYETHPEL
jgi:hypothetical protein